MVISAGGEAVRRGSRAIGLFNFTRLKNRLLPPLPPSPETTIIISEFLPFKKKKAHGLRTNPGYLQLFGLASTC